MCSSDLQPRQAFLVGVDCSSGSLGQGLSIANGLALAAKRQGKPYRSYCLLGDGEVQEGQVWEAAMTAAHYKLDNVCAIVDDNGVQLDGPTAQIMNVEPLGDKFAASWKARARSSTLWPSTGSTCQPKAAAETKGRPTVLLAQCVKGKGVSFMENQCAWHGKAPSREELAAALAQLV